MSSLWNFVKRHRGKLLVGGAIAGTAYAAKKFIDDHPELIEPIVNPEPSASTTASAALDQDAKKHFVFESNQRTCDASIQQLIPSMERKLAAEMNVEERVERLKTTGTEMDNKEKVAEWNRMKLESFTRVVTAVYSYTLLIVALKTQISLLARNVWRQSALTAATANSDSSSLSSQQGRRPANLEGLMSVAWDSLNSWMSGSNTMRSTNSGTDNSSAGTSQPGPAREDSAATQQLFLQSIQYFTSVGVNKLRENIEKVVTQVLSDVGLQANFYDGKLNDMLKLIRQKLELEGANLTFYIVPLLPSNGHQVHYTEGSLEGMLNEMKSVLEEENTRRLMDIMLNQQFDGVLAYCQPRLQTNGGIPLAKLIPSVTECFHRIGSMEFDSPLNEALLNHQLHLFCMNIFERPLPSPIVFSSN